MSNPNPNLLVVEDTDLKGVVIGLMKHYIPWSDEPEKRPAEIKIGNSASEILKPAELSTCLKSSGVRTLGQHQRGHGVIGDMACSRCVPHTVSGLQTETLPIRHGPAGVYEGRTAPLFHRLCAAGDSRLPLTEEDRYRVADDAIRKLRQYGQWNELDDVIEPPVGATGPSKWTPPGSS